MNLVGVGSGGVRRGSSIGGISGIGGDSSSVAQIVAASTRRPPFVLLSPGV
ncbi:hypothetical protein AB0L53_20190 [Nonomuraea sp. NPDC052129]|uniref:hypothetical protein n=1 Tax=Nonomuraea sp. NPDC052129 TaxID=3154651 RepID=UPI00342AB088